jgi:phosphate-selective porin OprO/OprP
MVAAAFTVAVVLLPQYALSQVPANPPPAAGFQDGFFVQTSDGANRLSIGMITQADGKFVLDDAPPATSTFTLRRLRPIFIGRVARYFEFRVIPDFGNGTAVIQDAFFDLRLASSFRIRAGKDKTPIGYEMLTPAARLIFSERSLASALVPNRDVGVQALGDIPGGKVSFAVGVFNGVPDGGTSTADVDTDGAKDVAGRLVVRPFQSSAVASSPLAGLGFQIGGSTGRQSGPLPTLRTSARQPYFSYANGATASGIRTRITPAVFYYRRSFGAFAEYVRSNQAVARNGLETDVSNRAWDVTTSYLLTGETATTGIIRPTQSFDPEAGYWGAFQIAMRYASLTVDRAAFDAGLAASGASRRARAVGIAANWYPNAYVRYAVTLERTTFDGSGASRIPAQTALVVRSQIAF